MLGQAAAMLIPFPATLAAKLGHGSLSLGFDQVGTFAGPAVAVFGGDWLGCWVTGIRGIWNGVFGDRCGGYDGGRLGRGGFASDRGLLAGAVHAARQIRAEAGGGSDRAGLPAFPTPTAVCGHRNSHGIARFFQGCSDRSSGRISSSGSGDTLATSHPMVGVDRTERDGMGVVTGVGLRKRARKGQFLFYGRSELLVGHIVWGVDSIALVVRRARHPRRKSREKTRQHVTLKEAMFSTWTVGLSIPCSPEVVVMISTRK